jgi:hypothetical protein
MDRKYTSNVAALVQAVIVTTYPFENWGENMNSLPYKTALSCDMELAVDVGKHV